MKTFTSKYSVLFLWATWLFLSLLSPPLSGAEEKTPPYFPEGWRKAKAPTPKPEPAAPATEVPAIDSKGFRTEEYVVKEGDWIAKILREKGALKDHTLPELLEVLRKLNASLQNMNMIQPGEKIVILVKVLPPEEGDAAFGPGKQSAITPPKRLKTKSYRVKRGDILSRVVRARYDLSARQFNREYLKLFKACNPSIENPDHIRLGQVIRLPLYPPQYDETIQAPRAFRDLDKSTGRVAISLPKSTPLALKAPAAETKAQVRTRPKPQKPDRSPPSARPKRKPVPAWSDQRVTVLAAADLGSIITRMGEEWIHTGEHFIPLKSSGQINLKAESYPIIRLNKGMTVIVDLHSALSKKMTKVIESSWKSYRVVRLSTKDDLRSALDKILRAFRYPKIYRKGQPVRIGGEIPVSITGDWIVTPPKRTSGNGPEFIVINLLQGSSYGTPGTIRDYLKPLGVEMIEYPRVEERRDDIRRVTALERAEDTTSLIRTVLNLTGQNYTTDLRIPAYETQNNDFKFTIEADFYLKPRGRRTIIDLSGLDRATIGLLKENGISVLSLAREREPLTMVAKTLKLLNVRFKPGPHLFLARPGNVRKNVELTLKGILFNAHNGDAVFVSPLNLPSEIGSFLSQKGYKVLVLSPFSPSNPGRAGVKSGDISNKTLDLSARIRPVNGEALCRKGG